MAHDYLNKEKIDHLLSIGGNVWESNPPKKLLTPQNGFEDRKEHQNPSTPTIIVAYMSGMSQLSISNRQQKWWR